MTKSNDRWPIEHVLVDPTEGQSKLPPQFPGFEGLPFRGMPPDLKNDDSERAQPKVGARVHVEILELNKLEDRKRMEQIYTMMCNGNAVISAEDRQYDPDIKSWRVMLRWADVFAYSTKGGIRG